MRPPEDCVRFCLLQRMFSASPMSLCLTNCLSLAADLLIIEKLEKVESCCDFKFCANTILHTSSWENM